MSSDEEDGSTVPCDEWGVIYSKEANHDSSRVPWFGRRELGSKLGSQFAEACGSPERVLQLVHRFASADSDPSLMQLRGIAWRVMLGLLPADQPHSSWGSCMRAKRAEYAALFEEYMLDPTKMDDDPLLSNPLSLDETSPWAQYHANQELLEEIETDLKRLYPEGCELFFEAPPVRRAMLNSLFVWSRMHPETSYRQGMHELMAPLVFVLEGEKVRPEAVLVDNDDLASLLDPSALEADVFWMFHAMMADLEPLFSTQGGARMAGQSEEEVTLSPALKLVHRIQNTLLARADPPVHAAMKALGITPQVYGLRWVRLMFGREFEIDDVLTLWDGLLGARFGRISSREGEGGCSRGPPRSLTSSIESIAVAMLLFVKEELQSGDYTTALSPLMRFPPVSSLSVIVERAMQLRDCEYRPAKQQPAASPVGVSPAGAGGGIGAGAGSSESGEGEEGDGMVVDDDPSLPPRTRLIRFYTKYNPTKLMNVDKILVKYRNNTDTLFAALRKKYSSGSETPTSGDASSSRETAVAPPPAPEPKTGGQLAALANLKLFNGSFFGSNDAGTPPPLSSDELMAKCGRRLDDLIGTSPSLGDLQEIADLLLRRRRPADVTW